MSNTPASLTTSFAETFECLRAAKDALAAARTRPELSQAGPLLFAELVSGPFGSSFLC